MLGVEWVHVAGVAAAEPGPPLEDPREEGFRVDALDQRMRVVAVGADQRIAIA